MDHHAGNCNKTGIAKVANTSTTTIVFETANGLADKRYSLATANGASKLDTISTGLLTQSHSIFEPTYRLPSIERDKSCRSGKSAARIVLPGEK